MNISSEIPTDTDARYWVGFNLVKGIGAARLRALLKHFDDLEQAWRAPIGELQAAGLSPRLAQAVVQMRSSPQLQQTWERIQARGIRVLTWDDPDYPARLKDVDQSPPVLYARGCLCEDDEWAVAIVGTRRMTSYGRQVTEELAAALARRGLTIVSGLARGVDAVAHQAALNAGGRTLAVLGSGVDVIYPPENRRLAEQMMSRGAILSDYPPGTPPDAANFPPRNRIVSGLVQAVVVIEAGESSGALITATFAAQQGRPVFAVPGPIYAPQSQGANRLIQNGAGLLTSEKDVLQALNLDLELRQERRSLCQALPADAIEAQLYDLLAREPLHVDEVGRQSNLPIEQVSATLALMELKGLVRQVGAMNYVAIRESEGDYSC